MRGVRAVDCRPRKQMTVADLLAQSRAAHDRYRRAANPRPDSNGHHVHPRDYATAEREVADALALRLEAHALDPEHTDEAWAGDAKATHEQLVGFYRTYLDTP